MAAPAPSFPSPRDPLQIMTSDLEAEYMVTAKVLGCGINGSVVECFRQGRKYALKEVRDCPESRREVELQWRASGCTQIVPLLAVFQKTEYTSHSMKRRLQVVMECMEGGELFDRISTRDGFTEKEAAGLMREICLAVKHLHDMNIAHRDLKPENLLYSSKADGARLKLGDFGFAKECLDNSGLKSAKYTPYYAAPEVLGPVGRQYGKSCDIWSVGVICYILLSGSPPFYTEDPHAAISPGMKRRIHSADYSFPANQWGHISQPAKDLIKGCLQANPQDRLTIDEVLQSPWICEHQEVPATPLATGSVLQEGSKWKVLQDELSRALTDMRRMDPDTTITLRNPRTEGSTLAKRRKIKAKVGAEKEDSMPEQEVRELKSKTGEEKKMNEAKTEEIVKQQDSGVEVREGADGVEGELKDEIKQAEMRDEVAEVSRCGEERRGSSDSGLERETS